MKKYASSPPAPMVSKKIENGCTRWNSSRYRPSTITPISSAASPILATRASVRVPLTLAISAMASRPTAVRSTTPGVAATPNRAATNPPPNSATAVIVTITAQM